MFDTEQGALIRVLYSSKVLAVGTLAHRKTGSFNSITNGVLLD